MKKGFALIVFLGLIVAGVAVSYTQVARPAKLKIGYLPIVDCLQLFVAVDKGFLAQEGIQPEMQILGGGAVILSAMAGGSLDMGFSAVDSLILAVDQGFDFLIAADGAYDTKTGRNNSVIMVRKDSGINRPKDLAGKKITLNAIKGIGELYVKELVKADGGDPRAVTIVELPFPQAGPALIGGKVDAANLVEPFYTIHGNDPGVKFLAPLFRDVRPGAMVANWVASKKWIEANAETVERFSRALRKATDYIYENPSEARAIIAKATRMAPEMAAKIGIKDFGKKVNLAELQWSADKKLEYGWIKRKLDARAMVYRTAE